MSVVFIIVSIIIILLFLLVFTFGFFMGLGRKKKDIKLLEKKQEQQSKTQESIIQHFLYKDKEEKVKDDESVIFPVKIINRSYKRIKKLLKIKKIISDIKELDTILYFRKYFLAYIGIAVLVFGFGYFVKFTINTAYINIAGRLFISVAVSTGLILLSHSIGKKYKTFSSIIMGGAIGSLYITFSISFYNYTIFSTLQVFSIFSFLTIFSVILSFVYNRYELLILVLLAGFIAPFISGIDYENFGIILLYILLLNIAALIITMFYKNILIRMIPSVFSGVYFVLWIYNSFQTQYFEDFEFGFFVALIIYIVLILLSIAYNLRHKVEKYFPVELSLSLAINLIFYTIGMYLLDVLSYDYKGVFTAFMSIINIAFLILVLKSKYGSTKDLIYLFSIISLLFLTLIPPVQLVGKSMTIVWAIETVFLLWFSLKLDIKMLKIASFFLILALISSFFMDVIDNYVSISQNSPKKILFFNKNFISGIMTSIGLAINFIILTKVNNKYLFKPIKMSWFRIFIIIISVVALYLSINTEILYRLTRTIRDINLLNMYMGIYNFAFTLLIMIGLVFLKNRIIRIFSGVIAILSVAFYFIVYYYEIILVREHLLMNVSISMTEFTLHVFIIGSLLFILFFSYINVKKINKQFNKISQWIIIILIITVLSSEIDHISVILNKQAGTPVSSIVINAHYFYYTLFWMISAFIVSFAALLFYDIELIRIAMFIIVITLLKMLIYDFTNINVFERTVSFITIGFVVLFIAFVRQRLFEKISPKKKHAFEAGS